MSQMMVIHFLSWDSGTTVILVNIIFITHLMLIYIGQFRFRIWREQTNIDSKILGGSIEEKGATRYLILILVILI